MSLLLNIVLSFLALMVLFLFTINLIIKNNRYDCLITYKGQLEGPVQLTKSKIYSNYVYKYYSIDNIICGRICLDINPILKNRFYIRVILVLLFIVFSFPYLIGLLIFNFKNRDLAPILDEKMSKEGCKRLHISDSSFDNIYMLDIDGLDFDFLIEYLPNNLKEKYLNIKNIQYRNSSLGGYYLLLNAIYDYYGQYYFPSFKEGKPVDVNLDFKFNISHSNNLVILATSYDEVGVDIEFNRVLTNSFKKKVFNNERIKDKEAIKRWTKIEAAIKLEGSSIGKYKELDFKKYKIETIRTKDYAISLAKYKK